MIDLANFMPITYLPGIKAYISPKIDLGGKEKTLEDHRIVHTKWEPFRMQASTKCGFIFFWKCPLAD